MAEDASNEVKALGITVGIVGAGSMGGAIAHGLVARGTLPASDVYVCDASKQRLAAFEQEGFSCRENAPELVAAGTDVVILAVKPQVLPSVLPGIAEGLAGRLVVSIAAGVALSTIEAALPTSRVVRVMPSLPIQVLSGASAVAQGTRATAEDAELVRQLFAALGVAEIMREDQLDAEGALIGCAPAFFALMVDVLTRRGIEAGLTAAASRSMAEVTMQGVAASLLASGEHPRAYMEKVTSPGGTTAAALRAMEPGLVESVYAGVDAALARTAELAAPSGQGEGTSSDHGRR